MGELTITQVYADMAGGVRWGEKNEIADAHGLKGHRLALFHLFGGGARKGDIKSIAVYGLDETRAIDTAAIVAPQPVPGALPEAVFPP